MTASTKAGAATSPRSRRWLPATRMPSSLARRLFLNVVLATLVGGTIGSLFVAGLSAMRVERFSRYVVQTFEASTLEIIKSHGEALESLLWHVHRQSNEVGSEGGLPKVASAARILSPDADLRITLHAPNGSLLRTIRESSPNGKWGDNSLEFPFIQKVRTAAGLIPAGTDTAAEQSGLRLVTGLAIESDQVLVASITFQVLASRIEAMYSGQVLVTDLDGRRLGGRPTRLSDAMIVAALQGPAYQALSFEGELYEVVRAPLDDMMGRRLGNLLLIKADDGQIASENLLDYASTVLVLFGLAVFIGLLRVLLRRELAPLSDIDRLTRSLSLLDLHAPAVGRPRTDELGRINQAIESLRDAAIERDQIAFATTTAQSHERRMIETELRQLAAMLDNAERESVFRILGEVVVTQQELKEHDGQRGETPLARAFQFMSARVQAQQVRVAALLEERTADLETVRQALAERSDLFRLREEVAVARSLQLSMLPDRKMLDPIREQVELEALTRPAKEVGGDSFDFQLLDSGRQLMFLVCDSSGKGIPAAMFVLTTKSLVSAASEAFGGLAAGLEAANMALARSNDSVSFTTLFIGLLNLESGVLTYSSAGHNPPLLRRSTGALEQLDRATGLVLGVFEDARYSEATVQLTPGDAIVLYTDGITEAHNPLQQMFDLSRLRAVCQSAPITHSQALIDRIMSSVDEFSEGEPQYDDITLMVLRYLGGDPPAQQGLPD